MKLNNLQKNFYIFFSVIISILVATVLWEKIILPFDNTTGTKGILAIEGYNPTNDTVRYIFFISLPLTIYLLFNYLLKNRIIKIKELIYEKNENTKKYNPIIILLSFIFVIFIFIEFFSISFSFSKYILDQGHDGAHLTPFQNYLTTKNFWISSFLTHGASDIFYPLLTWKVFGVNSIGSMRTAPVFLILFIKLLSVLLSYQFTKISKLKDNTKILFFTIFTSMLLSMSHYSFLGASYYISHKDIYIILFLIFFIELFVNSKLKYLCLILICLLATISIFVQIDRGAYIFFILAFYSLYLIASKKYYDFALIFFSLIIFLFILINLMGLEEFTAFLDNSKIIILTANIMHGLKYPEPFFSIGDHPDGARATKALLLQLATGLLTLNYLITNKNKIFISKKILFAFLFILSLVIYMNALGRSDSAHIRGSHDIPVLLCGLFLLNYSLVYLEKIFSKKNIQSQKTFLYLSVFYLFFHYTVHYDSFSYKNIKNYKKNFASYINLKDEVFLDQKTKNLIEYYKQISKEDNCVANVTYEDAIPYLLKKPSCTKYWASWLASPTIVQKKYIDELKKVQPKYILYYSDEPKYDGLGIYDRIEMVNSFILTNYKKHHDIHGYTFLEKK